MADRASALAALIDTNVLIYQLKNALSPELMQALGVQLENQQAFISVITRIEMLAWKGHSQESLTKTTQLVTLIPEFGLTEPIVQETIRIRKTYGLKLPDATIAATALVHNCCLWTANEVDFKRIPELQIRSI
jgi:predicted nucleic acid-binding protein